MNDLTYLNHFSFHEVYYSVEHRSAFRAARYNFIMYLQQGRAEITSGGVTLRLGAGDVLYIPRGANYSVQLYGTPDILFGSYAFMTCPDERIAVAALQKIDCTPSMRSHIDNVANANAVTCESVGNFYLFLAEARPLLHVSKADKRQATLERARSFIIKNPDSPIRDVARHCNVSESTLYSLFDELSTVTPAVFRLHAKLERAVEYLLSTDIPIETVSDLCGFSSSSYFRKKLFSVYGKTPSQIRKSGVGEILGF